MSPAQVSGAEAGISRRSSQALCPVPRRRARLRSGLQIYTGRVGRSSRWLQGAHRKPGNTLGEFFISRFRCGELVTDDAPAGGTPPAGGPKPGRAAVIGPGSKIMAFSGRISWPGFSVGAAVGLTADHSTAPLSRLNHRASTTGRSAASATAITVDSARAVISVLFSVAARHTSPFALRHSRLQPEVPPEPDDNLIRCRSLFKRCLVFRKASEPETARYHRIPLVSTGGTSQNSISA